MLDIIIKTGTLNFYCCYLTVKSLVVSASDTRNMGFKIVQKFEYRSQTQDL